MPGVSWSPRSSRTNLGGLHGLLGALHILLHKSAPWCSPRSPSLASHLLSVALLTHGPTILTSSLSMVQVYNGDEFLSQRAFFSHGGSLLHSHAVRSFALDLLTSTTPTSNN
eukprot:Gb_17735 [translate_table: standard]